MIKVRVTKHVCFKFRVSVNQNDIEEGKCGDPHCCMERIAIARALEAKLGEEAGRTRLDGAQIKFNYDGYRWHATTPKQAKVNLVRFDSKKPVRPHAYTVTAIRGTKIQKNSAERTHQINQARKARKAAGTPDKPAHTQSIHSRVIGLGAV